MSKIFGLFVVALLLFGGVAAYELRYFSTGVFDQSSLPTDQLYPMVIGGQQIYVKIADTPAKQQQGLSGTASLPQNQGMLFIFPSDGIYKFWMKDMNYPLDIIWLDSTAHVIYIAPDLAPNTYPQAFSSNTAARSVLEVHAGFAAQNNVQVGDVVHFQ